MKSRIAYGVVWLTALMASAHAADLGLKTGDVLVFLGDKVSEEYGGPQKADEVYYPTLVESFLTVRYPELRVSFWNRSMDGATAATTLERWNRDVAPLKPTVVLVCLGAQETGANAADAAMVEKHKESMVRLLQTAKQAGCRVYVMSPPSVLDSGASPGGPQPGVANAARAKLADAQRDIATAEKAVYIDWNGETQPGRKGVGPALIAAADGVRYGIRAHALAASLILDAWKAEPIAVEMTMDWKAGSMQSNVGRATASIGKDDSREIRVTGLPLPWPMAVGQTHLMASEGEASKWCRFMLKVTGVPSSGVLTSDGSRQGIMLAQQLTEGTNLIAVDPLRSLQAAQDLLALIRRKNYTRVHAWRDQELQPIKEPELVEGQKTLIDAWHKYVEGYEKIIARTPKTFDFFITFSELKMPTLPSAPVTRPAGAAN